jgi:hypothetical protein
MSIVERLFGDEKVEKAVGRELSEEELEKIAGGKSAAGNLMATTDAAAEAAVEGDAASDAERDSDAAALRNPSGDDA